MLFSKKWHRSHINKHQLTRHMAKYLIDTILKLVKSVYAWGGGSGVVKEKE